jgi:hypothetical protein
MLTLSVIIAALSFADNGCATKRNSSVWTVRVTLFPELRVARRRRLFLRSAGSAAVSCVAISNRRSGGGGGPSRRAVRDDVIFSADDGVAVRVCVGDAVIDGLAVRDWVG